MVLSYYEVYSLLMELFLKMLENQELFLIDFKIYALQKMNLKIADLRYL